MMRINKNRNIQNRRSYIKRTNRRSPATEHVSLPERDVILGGNAAKMVEVVGMIRLLPDTRKDLVKRLHHEITSGGYHLYSEAVAEKILSEYEFESVLRG